MAKMRLSTVIGCPTEEVFAVLSDLTSGVGRHQLVGDLPDLRELLGALNRLIASAVNPSMDRPRRFANRCTR